MKANIYLVNRDEKKEVRPITDIHICFDPENNSDELSIDYMQEHPELVIVVLPRAFGYFEWKPLKK